MNGIFDLGAKCHVQGGDRIFDDIAEYTWKHASRSLSTWKPTKTLTEMTMRVHRSELRLYPFSLTDKNEISVKIVKELVTDQWIRVDDDFNNKLAEDPA